LAGFIIDTSAPHRDYLATWRAVGLAQDGTPSRARKSWCEASRHRLQWTLSRDSNFRFFICLTASRNGGQNPFMIRTSFLAVLVAAAFVGLAAYPRTMAHSQSASTGLQFEVASVKPTQPGGGGVRQACHGVDSKRDANDMNTSVPLGRCMVSAGRLSHMIGIAYGISMDMLKGGPEWVTTGNDRYDVDAKAENPATATEAQLLEMFRVLLVERFKLKFHFEPHEISAFALVVAKNGPKLQESAPGNKGKLIVTANGRAEPDAVKGAPEGVPMTITGQNITMDHLAGYLEPFVRGPVLNDTHLSAVYDVKLTWEAGQSMTGPLQNQLGLRLEPRKKSVNYIVVESAEKPSIN
jgi:uncharacterized protein (TIGR03435 family)